MSTETTTATSSSWKNPTELSLDEYNELLQEIGETVNEEIDNSETVAVSTASVWLSIWGPELLDAARYNEIDVVRGILQVTASAEAASRNGAVEVDTPFSTGWSSHVSTNISSNISTPTGSNKSPTGNQRTETALPAIPPLSDVLAYQDASTGNTALHMAAANGHVAILQLLLWMDLPVNEGAAQVAVAVAEQSVRTQAEQCSDSLVESPASSGSTANTTGTTSRPHRQWLHQIINRVGNTALHWAAANGQTAAVQILLALPSTDVLQKNHQGRSILTEGFSSNHSDVMELVLSHESASEERLVSTTGSAPIRIPHEDDDEDENESEPHQQQEENDTDEETDAPHVAAAVEATRTKPIRDTPSSQSSSPPLAPTVTPAAASVVHTFAFGRRLAGSHRHGNDTATTQESNVTVRIREWAMATSDETSILGQDDPTHDTTGWSVWASSLICAQWMAALLAVPPAAASAATAVVPSSDRDTVTIMELGAGCGVPGLTVARALSHHRAAATTPTTPQYHVFLTDFNPSTVENLRHNISLNQPFASEPDSATAITIQALCMNWNDPSTWPQLPLQQQPDRGVDLLIGSDLLYQLDMVPLLLQTVLALRPLRFLYVAHTQRSGHAEFVAAMEASQYFSPFVAQAVPDSYMRNPLLTQDDDEFFVHFHELVMASNNGDHGFVLYDFHQRTKAPETE